MPSCVLGDNKPHYSKASSHSQEHYKHLKLTFEFSMLGNTTAMFILTQQTPTWLNILIQ